RLVLIDREGELTHVLFDGACHRHAFAVVILGMCGERAGRDRNEWFGRRGGGRGRLSGLPRRLRRRLFSAALAPLAALSCLLERRSLGEGVEGKRSGNDGARRRGGC